MSNLFNGLIFSTSLLSGGLSYWYSIKEKILEYDTLNKCQNGKNSFFINYDDNLYDISKLINKNPGDPSKISFVTGKILENYWEILICI